MTDAVALCAHGEASWHALAYRSLGAAWGETAGVARSFGPVPHPLLFGAVTLRLDAEVAADVPGIVCDSYARLTLPGREAEAAGHWMIREPSGRPSAWAVPGLQIRPVANDDDVAWFEYLAFLAAGDELPGRSGELHPSGSQRLPGLTLLIAEIDGEGVGTALSVVTSRVNNVGAVAVMPARRGRGIGSALTKAAIAVAPELPATLAATPSGRGVYRRLGFTEVGRPLHHHPSDGSVND